VNGSARRAADHCDQHGDEHGETTGGLVVVGSDTCDQGAENQPGDQTTDVGRVVGVP